VDYGRFAGPTAKHSLTQPNLFYVSENVLFYAVTVIYIIALVTLMNNVNLQLDDLNIHLCIADLLFVLQPRWMLNVQLMWCFSMLLKHMQ